MFQLSATGPNSCPQPKLSVINHLINDHLLDAWQTVIQMSSQLVNISHRILIDPLLYYCRDSVIYVLNSGMLGSHRLGATIEARRFTTKLLDGCACTMRWLTVGYLFRT